MSHESIVTAQDVLRAITQLKRRGLAEMLKELEATEPELAEHLLEETTVIHHRLYKGHLSHTRHQRLTRRLQRLCVVLVNSTQAGYRRLLSDDGARATEVDTD